MEQIDVHIDINYKNQIKQRHNLLKSIRGLQKQGRPDRLSFWKREKHESESSLSAVAFTLEYSSGAKQEAENTKYSRTRTVAVS